MPEKDAERTTLRNGAGLFSLMFSSVHDLRDRFWLAGPWQ